jgi:hypothetical protein
MKESLSYSRSVHIYVATELGGRVDVAAVTVRFLADSSSWLPKIDWPLSVGTLPFGNMGRVTPQGRYV